MGFDFEVFKKQLIEKNLEIILQEPYEVVVDSDVSSSLSNVFMLLSLMFRYPTDKVYDELFVNFGNFELFFEEYLGAVPVLPVREDLEPEYVSLFVANKGGVPAPLYASVYTNNEKLLLRDSTIELKDMMVQCGFEIGEQVKDIEDNLYIMLEFVSALCGRLAAGLDCQKDVLLLLSVMISVVEKYIGSMVQPFGSKVAEVAKISFYKDAAVLLEKVIFDSDGLMSELIDIKEIAE